MPEPGPADRRQPFLSVPKWDISDEEISEWRKTPGMRLAGLTAEHIRDGVYDNGQEIHPPDSGIYREVTRDYVDQCMKMLAERGMARKLEGRWYAIAPGRMEPSLRRAVCELLARRADLPPDLTAALDSWKPTLDALQAPAACQPTRQRLKERPSQPGRCERSRLPKTA